MKNKNVFKIIVCICIVSLVINLIYFLNHNKRSEYFIYEVYSYIINIEKILENIENGLKSQEDKWEISSMMQYMEDECRMLDRLIRMVGYAINKKYETSSLVYLCTEVNGRFPDLESQLKFINDQRYKIKSLLQKLSKDKEILYDEYKNIQMNPNYSLSIKKIIKMIEQTQW